MVNSQCYICGSPLSFFGRVRSFRSEEVFCSNDCLQIYLRSNDFKKVPLLKKWGFLILVVLFSLFYFIGFVYTILIVLLVLLFYGLNTSNSKTSLESDSLSTNQAVSPIVDLTEMKRFRELLIADLVKDRFLTGELWYSMKCENKNLDLFCEIMNDIKGKYNEERINKISCIKRILAYFEI